MHSVVTGYNRYQGGKDSVWRLNLKIVFSVFKKLNSHNNRLRFTHSQNLMDDMESGDAKECNENITKWFPDDLIFETGNLIFGKLFNN